MPAGGAAPGDRGRHLPRGREDQAGTITPQFKGQATFVERDDAGHRAVLKAEGRDTGGRGNAAGRDHRGGREPSPTSTRVVVTTDLHITGKVAQFGRGIIGDVSKKLMAQFATNLNTMLDEPPAGGNDEWRRGAATSTKPTGGARPKPASADADAGATRCSLVIAPRPLRPRAPDAPPVRKIDGPATEPVDLAGVAGPAVLKRLRRRWSAWSCYCCFVGSRRR